MQHKNMQAHQTTITIFYRKYAQSVHVYMHSSSATHYLMYIDTWYSRWLNNSIQITVWRHFKSCTVCKKTIWCHTRNCDGLLTIVRRLWLRVLCGHGGEWLYIDIGIDDGRPGNTMGLFWWLHFLCGCKLPLQSAFD